MAAKARPVTMKELSEWVKKNISKTWFTGTEFGENGPFNVLSEEAGFSGMEVGGFSGRPGHTPLIKYITPVLDCRDMKVFSITFRGAMPETNVNGSMEFDGTILELFESKFPDDFKKEPSNVEKG